MSDGANEQPAKPWTRWTADTERAFLYALRRTGRAGKAAAEIGRSKNGAFSRRRTHPEFAAQWDEVVAAQQAEWAAAHRDRLERAKGPADDGAGGGRLTPYRERPGGWDARKRGLFLRALTRTKCVESACAAAGMSTSAAYYLRSQSPRFAAAWEKALAAGAPPSVLEAAMARAVEGWEEPILYAGEVVAHKQRYSDGLLRDLLKTEQGRGGAGSGKAGAMGGASARPVVAAGAAAVAPAPAAPSAAASEAGRVTEAELNESLLRNLAFLRERLIAKKRVKDERTWERWRTGWVDPVLAAPTAEDLRDEDEDWDEEDT